jgi:hypothetical protein
MAVYTTERPEIKEKEFYSTLCPNNCTEFEVFTAVIVKNAVFWDVTPCCCCKNRCVLRLLVTANVVPTSPTLVTLMIKKACPSGTSVLRKATSRNIPEDGIPQLHRSSVHFPKQSPSISIYFPQWFTVLVVLLQ